MRGLSGLFLISHLQAELNRLFRDALEPGDAVAQPSGWQPRVDVVETEESLVIVAEVAGMRADDLEVEVEGEVVTIRGRKQPAGPARAEARYLCMERGRGAFERSLRVSLPVNSHRGRARLGGGLLRVELPRIRDQRRRAHRLAVEEADTEETP